MSEGGFVEYNVCMSTLISFLNEVIAELKKVTWPTREETIKLTVVVIAISIIVGAFIGGLDWMFLKITTFLFKQ